jgi:hypothetical protein
MSGNGGNGSSRGKQDGHVDGDVKAGEAGTRNGGRRALPTVTVDPVEGLAPLSEFPASERVFLTEGGDQAASDIRVPVRRIHVGAGEPPLDVYDTFGPR